MNLEYKTRRDAFSIRLNLSTSKIVFSGYKSLLPSLLIKDLRADEHWMAVHQRMNVLVIVEGSTHEYFAVYILY